MKEGRINIRTHVIVGIISGIIPTLMNDIIWHIMVEYTTIAL